MVKKVLFVTYGGGHANMVYPVVEALRSSTAAINQQLVVDVFALPAALETFRTKDISPLSFANFIEPTIDGEALRWGRELATLHHSPTLGVTMEESIAYLGLSYMDLVHRFGASEAKHLFDEKGRHAFFPLTAMARVFDHLRPDMVVTTNSPRSEAAAIAVANERGIPTLAMTDLFTGLGYYRIEAGDITFLNSVACEMFQADGLVDPALSRFHCTGNPAFDKLLGLSLLPDIDWIDRHFPGAGLRRTVLHADMPAYWDNHTRSSHFKTVQEIEEELNAVYQACCANQAEMLVRPHPSQDRAFYAHWVSTRPHAWVAAECDLHALLINVDLLVSRTTTVGLEAAFLRRRILQLDWQRHADLPLAAMGIAWGSAGYDTLAHEIDEALNDDQRFRVMCERFSKIFPFEPASQRVAGLVLDRLNLSF